MLVNMDKPYFLGTLTTKFHLLKVLIIGWLYLNTEDIRKKSDELFKLENGSDRFVLLDERDFSIEVMKEKILK